MAYPTTLDSLTNPTAGDKTNSATVPHATQHANVNDAVEALEAKVGIGSSTPTSNTVFAGTGTGTSAYTATPTVTDLTATGKIVIAAVSGTPVAHALYRDNVPKAWGCLKMDGSFDQTYNVSTLTDNGPGDVTVTFLRAFAAATYCAIASAQKDPSGTAATTLVAMPIDASKATTTCRFNILRVSDGAVADPTRLNFVCFGGQ